MNPRNKINQTQAAKSHKKPYETPTLTLYGGVEDITQDQWKWGTGDAFMQTHNLPDVLAGS